MFWTVFFTFGHFGHEHILWCKNGISLVSVFLKINVSSWSTDTLENFCRKDFSSVTKIRHDFKITFNFWPLLCNTNTTVLWFIEELEKDHFVFRPQNYKEQIVSVFSEQPNVSLPEGAEFTQFSSLLLQTSNFCQLSKKKVRIH